MVEATPSRAIQRGEWQLGLAADDASADSLVPDWLLLSARLTHTKLGYLSTLAS